jgi:regulator of replication initiation timing
MKFLHPEVAAKYQLIGIRPGKYNFKGFGEIDLCGLSVARADALVARGFTHLKLRQGVAPGAANAPVPNLKARPIGAAAKTEKETQPETTPEELRKNKQYVNKLLTMDWKDLSHQDHLVFFNNQSYFMKKKEMFLEISSMDRDMKSLHAKLKSLKTTEERKATMNRIAYLENGKIEYWSLIDKWIAPETDPEKIAEGAAAAALNKDRQIKTNRIYIYRAEISIPGMPEKFASERERKAKKIAEVEKRKAELIELGSPYTGKEE